jgi:hypothetical protein
LNPFIYWTSSVAARFDKEANALKPSIVILEYLTMMHIIDKHPKLAVHTVPFIGW